jgi:DNA-binding CsgD family transcriptional regulator
MTGLILLTTRQQEVLEMLNQGMVEQQIARRLWRSYNTVRTHTRNLREYFDAHSNSEVVVRARAWGFVGPADWPVGSGPLLAVLRWAS